MRILSLPMLCGVAVLDLVWRDVAVLCAVLSAGIVTASSNKGAKV